MTRILAAATIATVIAGAAFVLPNQARSQEPVAGKEQIEQIVKDYILGNPEIIVEALTTYQQEQQEKMAEMQSKNLGKYLDYLHAEDRPAAGNPKGDVTLVEFFDYNCGYCKRALDDVLEVMESDKNLRVVLIEMPILGPASEIAARWALAAQKQGKYFPFHVALMKHTGQKSEAVLSKIAEEAGLDVARLKKDIDAPEITAEIEKNREVAADLGLSGTPAFIVDDEISRGYIGAERLKQQVEAARE